MEEKFVCCICGKECTGWPNDPWPVCTDPKAGCCDSCNNGIVLAARLRGLVEKTSEVEI